MNTNLDGATTGRGERRPRAVGDSGRSFCGLFGEIELDIISKRIEEILYGDE